MNSRHLPRRSARHVLLGAATMLAIALGAACGGGGSAADPDTADDEIASLGAAATPPTGSGAPTASEAAQPADLDPEEAMLAWAECMRAHGVDMPDPDVEEGGMVISFESGDDNDREVEAFDDAARECDHLLESAHGDFELDPAAQAEIRDAFLAYAECMREHGIEMPDPEFGEQGDVTMSFGAEGGPGIDDEAFEEADRACLDEHLFGDVPDPDVPDPDVPDPDVPDPDVAVEEPDEEDE